MQSAMAMRAVLPARATASRQSATVSGRALKVGSVRAARPAVLRAGRVMAAATVDNETGITKMRDGIKVAAAENALTPRFYTTDFEECERLFGGEWASKLNEEEMEAMLAEFR